jgi:hypothetical protein
VKKGNTMHTRKSDEIFFNEIARQSLETSLALFRRMGRNLCCKAISLIMCLALVGCETDQQRTVTEGTAIGAGLGGVIGAGLGAAAGALTGNSQNIVRGAIAGGILGASIGGVAGYQWGKRVAFKKDQYRTSEDRLNANIRRASQVRAAAARENNALRGQITQLNGELRQLSGQAAASNNDRQARITLAHSVNQRRADVARKIEAAGNEIEDRTEALRADRNGDPQKVAELKGQIAGLSAERAQLQENNRRLAAISSRIGV